jgi:hypothetical protein
MSEKLDVIRAIHQAGLRVEIYVIRHGLSSERHAYDVEAALIDLMRLVGSIDPESPSAVRLTNAVLGHRHAQFGLANIDVVGSLYDAPAAPDIDEPVVLLKIPVLWNPQLTTEDLYESTRGWWVIGIRREKAKFAFAVSKGVIRATYKIDRWRQTEAGDRGWVDGQTRNNRWGFDGRPAPEMAHYLNTSVAHLFKRGEASPVKLLNC